MSLDEIPEEVRSLFDYAGLMADTADNERTRLAFQGLQLAIENDWDRLKKANLKFANDNAQLG